VFSEYGFAGATVRAIAERAGADPSMIYHWFGGKRALFAATVDPPFDAVATIDEALAGDPATVGHRAVQAFLRAWDEHRERFTAIIRYVCTQPAAAAELRKRVTTEIAQAIARHLEVDRPRLRASWCVSHLAGLAMARYVLELDSLGDAEVDHAVAVAAPTMQRYLTGQLD
jgi:AcrR family transcriptional regulator